MSGNKFDWDKWFAEEDMNKLMLIKGDKSITSIQLHFLIKHLEDIKQDIDNDGIIIRQDKVVTLVRAIDDQIDNLWMHYTKE